MDTQSREMKTMFGVIKTYIAAVLSATLLMTALLGGIIFFVLASDGTDVLKKLLFVIEYWYVVAFVAAVVNVSFGALCVAGLRHMGLDSYNYALLSGLSASPILAFTFGSTIYVFELITIAILGVLSVASILLMLNIIESFQARRAQKSQERFFIRHTRDMQW